MKPHDTPTNSPQAPPKAPQYIAIVAQTLDGFIAKNPTQVSTTWTSPEDKTHFLSMLETFDWLVAGRTTAEQYTKPLGKYHCLVFTSAPQDQKEIPGFTYINPDKKDPAAFFTQNKAGRIGVIGGTRIYDYFLENGLLDELWLTIEPKAFGSGIPAFTHPEHIEEFLTLASDKALNETGTRLRHYVK